MAPPTGPLDPWTGLQGGPEESYYAPMGQVQQWGRLSRALGRDPSTIHGYRRWVVRVGLVLIGLVALIGILAAFLQGHQGS